MAAYAALVSLMNTVEQILNHPRLSASLYKFQVEFLSEKIGFFLDFIESYDSHEIISKEAEDLPKKKRKEKEKKEKKRKKKAEDLKSQITSAAHAAEDVIESHIVDRIHAGSNNKSLRFFLDLQKIIVDMVSIKEKVMKVKEERRVKYQPTYSMPVASSRPLSTGKIAMVGFEAYLTQLLDGLTGYQSNRQIIPIVGMGGIGKTTLARNAYENSLIVQHFDIRAWVIISQEYSVQEILSKILSCVGESSSGIDKYTEDELGERLYKILSGRRYLIILDDMWSIEAWNKIQFLFPENHSASRIIVTTRLLNVADQFGSLKIAVNFLDDDESWILFCKNAFGEEGCPCELEEVGKKIVKKCGGLPLSIVVTGGILGKSSRTQERWENVRQHMSSIVNSEDNSQCLNILSLGYSHLPACLKPCFLYFGIFPEDHEIRVSQLVKLWVAEGFLKPNEDQSLEEIAEDYIKDLVDRNLILVRCLGRNGRLKTCYMHDLLRDLCSKIARKENFLCIMRVLDTPRDRDRERRIITRGSLANNDIHPPAFHTLESTSLARSLIKRGSNRMLGHCRLLRVLFVEAHPYYYFPEIPFQVNLRFMAFVPNNYLRKIFRLSFWRVSSSISLRWNLQTFIFDVRLLGHELPSEIWEMPQLRHIKIQNLKLPDPPPSEEEDDCVVLQNLQTLKRVKNFRCSDQVIKRMPNIKKLSIDYDASSCRGEEASHYCLYNVDRLNKLESLKCSFDEMPNRENLLQNFTFPSSLKKLCLVRCGLHWNDLTIIGSLPNLEVLYLKWGSVIGPEWNPVEGGFCRLKFLEIRHCGDLIYWDADKSHFPVLENLALSDASKLNEIPSGIGDIPTLQRIHLKGCSTSAGISAIKILEEQESFGNESLRLEVSFWSSESEKREEFRELMQNEGFTVHNFRLS